MQRFVKAAVASTLALGLAAPAAFAGSLVDPVVETPVMVQPAMPSYGDFEGFGFGAIGTFMTGTTTTTAPFTSNPNDATIYGAFANYQMQSGNFVYGAEIAAQRGNGSIGAANFVIDYQVDAKLKAGYAMGQVMAYATGGFTMGQLSPAIAPGVDSTFTGWNAGLGLEFAVSENVFIAGEYLYRDTKGTLVGTNYRNKDHGVSIKVGYRF